MARRDVVHHRGWEIVHMRAGNIGVDVLPGKGGDVLSVRWHGPSDAAGGAAGNAADNGAGTEVLWQSPWGLRRQGSVNTAASSAAAIIEAYPGGWQTVFPNGGRAVVEHGIEWGMHGEVWLTPFDWSADGDAIVMRARLVRSPFDVVKRVSVTDAAVTVTETVTNVGGRPIDVMWGQHPAFGPPLIGPETRITTNARSVIVDPLRDTPGGDLVVGARSSWPHALARRGGEIDLSRVPNPSAGVERMAYLADFEDQAEVVLVNDRLGLAAELTWRAADLPYAWYWLEAGGTAGFPWFNSTYVLAIEPASSYPGAGLHHVRSTTGTHLAIQPGQSRQASVQLRLSVPE